MRPSYRPPREAAAEALSLLHALRALLERARFLQRDEQALLPRRAAHEQLVFLRVLLVVDVLFAAQLRDVPAERARDRLGRAGVPLLEPDRVRVDVGLARQQARD